MSIPLLWLQLATMRTKVNVEPVSCPSLLGRLTLSCCLVVEPAMLMALGMTVQRDVKEEVKLEHGTMVCVDLQT